MLVQIDDIGPQGLDVTGAMPAAWQAALGADLSLAKPELSSDAHLKLTRRGDRVFVRGDILVRLSLPCSACLQPVGLGLQVDVDICAVPEAQRPKADSNGELTAEAIDMVCYSDDTLDVGRMVHDEVLLEVPHRVLCQQDCQGLCPRCGSNRNEAPCVCDPSPPTGPFAALANSHWPTGAKKKA